MKANANGEATFTTNIHLPKVPIRVIVCFGDMSYHCLCPEWLGWAIKFLRYRHVIPLSPSSSSRSRHSYFGLSLLWVGRKMSVRCLGYRPQNDNSWSGSGIPFQVRLTPDRVWQWYRKPDSLPAVTSKQGNLFVCRSNWSLSGFHLKWWIAVRPVASDR